MAICAGSRFGHYEIIDVVGAGGMGEVWRVRDTSLKREVALKALPQAFIDDADRLARFQREAEILAALNHPNIAQIHGLEKADGLTAIVMELVEGPTLAERIMQGPIPADEALGIALQLVAALEAAHAKQIVHRDLKPANVVLRADGTVKVLDFGISKPIDASAISGGSPVMTTPAVTQTGVILGTAAYMSPEQARGRFVDERTDIWAFGCLLLEMLTGQAAFGGEDVMATLARVIDRAADLSSMPKTISPAVRHTIRLCLEKDPAKRIADIRDVRLALMGRFESELPREAAAAARKAPASRFAGPALALVAGVTLAAVASAVLWPAPAPRPLTQFPLVLPAERQFNPGTARILALAPDGRSLGYAADDGFFLRDFASLGAERRLVGSTGGIVNPLFTADGAEIVYIVIQDQRLTANTADPRPERIPAAGGLATPIVDASVLAAAGIASPTSVIPTPTGTFLLTHLGGVSEYDPVGGGRIARRIDLGNDSLLVTSASLLPDSDTVLMTALDGANLFSNSVATLNNTPILAASLSAADGPAVEPRTIVPRGSDPRYLAATGHLLFVRDNIVHAAAFDLGELAIRGNVTPVLPDVRQPFVGGADYQIADNGTLAFVQNPAGAPINEAQVLLDSARVSFGWHYADGRFEPLTYAPSRRDPGYLRVPVLSPDSTRLAVAIQSETVEEFDLDIWVYDLRRPGTRTLIAGTSATEAKAVWMPDGESLIFFRDGAGLFRRKADASDRETLLLALPAGIQNMIPDFVHPNGTELVFTMIKSADAAEPSRGLYRLPLTGAAEPVPVLDEPGYDESSGSLSPDGAYLAYRTTEAGSDQIHIRPYPDVSSRRIVVSTDGGSDPQWDAGGGYLDYIEGVVAGNITNAGSLIRVAVETSPALALGAVERVIDRSMQVVETRPNFAYDTAADRWLVYRLPLVAGATAAGAASTPAGATSIVVVENWTEWLKREVPVGDLDD